MGVSVMDGTIRIRTVAWFATAIVLSVICTLLVTQAWSAGAAPGDEDSTFVPTAGCRVADTRPAPNTVGVRSAPLAAGDIFEVTVHGENGNCTGPLAIPTDAVAVALNVTAVNATASSNIRIYPANLTEVPLLSNLNVTAGAPPTPNKVDVKLSPDGKIRVFNFRGSVNIFIDIVGYYTNSSLIEVETRLAALEASDAAQDNSLDAVAAELPFVASDVEGRTVDNLSTNSGAPTEIAAVSIVAPAAGTISAWGTGGGGFNGGFGEGGGGSGVQAAICQVTTADRVSLNNGPVGIASLEIAGIQSLAATNSFDVEAGSTTIVRFLCYGQNSPSIDLFRPGLIALFTPAP